MNDLTQSAIDRQNILNNVQAVEKIQTHIGLTGLLYEGEYLFTSKMIADFYGVTTRTLTNIVNSHEDEIKHNGYQLIVGNKLKEFKALFGPLLSSFEGFSQKETDFPLSSESIDNQSFKRLKSLAVYNFRAFLNIAMLLTESEKAKMLRSTILDIVLDTLNQKVGGSTKFIQRNN